MRNQWHVSYHYVFIMLGWKRRFFSKKFYFLNNQVNCYESSLIAVLSNSLLGAILFENVKIDWIFSSAHCYNYANKFHN